METKNIIKFILGIVLRTCITVGLAFLALLVLAETYGKHLCNDISTCYALVVFLAGTAITLKIKLLDDKTNWRELILFSIGAILNVLILMAVFTLHCFKREEDVLLVLNFAIWINSIIVIRSLCLMIVSYTKNYREVAKNNNEEIPMSDCEKLVNHLRTVVGIKNIEVPNSYRSLPLYILDDIYSLRSRYETVARPTVDRFINHFLGGDPYIEDYSIDAFIKDLESNSRNKIASKILKNRQVTGNRRKIEVCYDIALKLKSLNIQTTKDFCNYSDKTKLEAEIKSIKGVGLSATNYLFMLTGDFSRIKPDTHIHRCVKEAIGHALDENEYQQIFSEAAEVLANEYHFVTPRLLDFLTWSHYSERSKQRTQAQKAK